MNGETDMFVVHFLEHKNVLLSQFRNVVPSVGEDITIKGRKAKVSSVENIDQKHVHVQIIYEKVNVSKNKALVDNSKKKKR